MSAIEVCRLCPSTDKLVHVFDKTIFDNNNMKEVILLTTGIEILEQDIVSQKICARCCKITLKMFQFRQDALKQDRTLKEKCGQSLRPGMKIPNTNVTIKREPGMPIPKIEPEQPESLNSNVKKKPIMHPSVKDAYISNPSLKIPGRCFKHHIAPIVSLTMGEVENYFRKRKLDMRRFIYHSRPISQTPRHNKVAKKKTTVVPPTEKTVAPLKISKKMWENRKDSSDTSSSSYVCTTLKKTKKSRKRPLSDDSESSVNAKTSRRNSVSRSATPLMSPIPEDGRESSVSRSATPMSPIPEDVLERCPSIYSSDGGSKPDFIESLGLTPTVTTTKSQPLHICTLCGSVHYTAFDLKRHSNRHMVCQFCKLRFKSIESKDDHFENFCEVKKIMNSTGPVVKLEKVHLNLTVRKKYKGAFKYFAPIPGLEELTPVEEVVICEPPSTPINDVIEILSDDEESQGNQNDPLSVVQAPAEENVFYNTVSIVKPDIRIKNNTLSNNLTVAGSDVQVIKELLRIIKPKPTLVEKMLQTSLPSNRDIKISNADETCELKNLREHLRVFRVPLTISNGPFSVAYNFKESFQREKYKELWNEVFPMTDVSKNLNKSLNKLPSTIGNLHTQPAAVTNANPQSQSNGSIAPLAIDISKGTTPNSSIVATPMVNTVLQLNSPSATIQTPTISSINSSSNLSSIKPKTSSSSTPGLVQTSSPTVNTSLNSATPLLQKYVLSMSGTSAVSKTVSNVISNTPSKHVAKSSSITVPSNNNRSLSTTVNRPNSITTTPLSSFDIANPLSNSRPTIIITSSNNAVLNVSTIPVASPIINHTSTVSTNSTGAPPTILNGTISNTTFSSIQLSNCSTSTTPTTPSVVEAAKFRVKSVWELQ